MIDTGTIYKKQWKKWWEEAILPCRKKATGGWFDPVSLCVGFLQVQNIQD